MTEPGAPGEPGEPADPLTTGSAPDTGQPARPWRIIGRWLAATFIVGSFAFWAWAFSPWARSENPARLDDRDFASRAEERCGRVRAVIDALPTARQAQSRAERAGQVDMGTAEVESMVEDLRGMAESSLTQASDGSGPSDTELVAAWLDDWQTYIADRRNHAERLLSASEATPDRDLRFLLVDMTEGSTYTERMDGFARLNDMDACQIPGDV